MKKNNRRNFIKTSAVLTAALSLGGKSTAIAATDQHLKPRPSSGMKSIVKDAGMVMSEAFFGGRMNDELHFADK
ncbi:MAG: twin-arginine translocation signal domain-containing protein [Saprospiraceae bacterium]|nr:twin-arginine translocation signal domain-containing protein [Saprospiraceae bacterium]